MVSFPFTENDNIRHFSVDVSQDDLEWHWDEQDRYITPIDTTDWEIQFDNELPKNMNCTTFIPKGIFHRLIKGSNDLYIKVIKC